MSRAPLLTLLFAAAAFAALPLSLHFEGNDGTAEPFIAVFPVAALLAAAGMAIAFRRGMRVTGALNLCALGLLAAYWIFLVTYEGD